LYVSNEQIEVDVLDFDNEEFESGEIEDKELLERSKGLKPIL